MLIDHPQSRAKDRFKLLPVPRFELADVRVPCIECKSSKPLGPFIDEFVQRVERIATGGCVPGKHKAVAVIFVHSVLPPREVYLRTTVGAENAFKVRAAIKERDLVGDLDVDLVSVWG